ncbi:unnamed protein product [Rotaria magnacalcarata]|uniref:Peptidase S9 prolyl oligopeptidase catalytic domain-containing protein n=1 Tax=Rotaria magnacalcarata TaxID=392030 RepID=A0A815YMT7_9BILA|nr:unnamed protein product [Rotaria magnacalcarata]CAF1639720.1 unnamed protein product [Rotaria magnacalcarata]CAF2163603.1 unnamed protein product [Rotaria magnacalcarata]CAF3763012.1 unnamed protein product [Rotaria magnacalcarata]CAF3793265.1 unnamed protein product [Rotaria magnacalcarata]
MILIPLYFLFVSNFILCLSTKANPILKFDEFFNYTQFPSLSLSPNGQHLLIHTQQPSWKTDSFENSLWLYDTFSHEKTLITKKLSESFKPRWSPNGNWVVLLLESNDFILNSFDQYIYLYSILSNQLLPIQIGIEILTTIAWSLNDLSLYFVTIASKQVHNEDEWKDVIQYRASRSNTFSKIYRIDINRTAESVSTQIDLIQSMPFLVGELVFVPSEEKLVVTSLSGLSEQQDDFEIYSINLKNISLLQRLTHNQLLERDLQLSHDGKHILFHAIPMSSNNGLSNNTQYRVYSINLRNGKIVRLAKDFNGAVFSYVTKSDGGVYVIGQLGTNVHIYTQESSEKDTILRNGWNGTYESITTSSFSNSHCSIAFVYSSYERPKEVYCITDINKLQLAKRITDENKLFTERNLPKIKSYQWINSEDDRKIEGILYYPPEKFEAKNLSLLVLIHGGPYAADVNSFNLNPVNWAPLAASEGWLVLEPNYRGSTGYGDQYLREIRYQPLSLPGRDILSGIDSLIEDGIVNPNSISVGGYSYGAYLTNWLITQTTRFNAALTGAGATEHASSWGTTDGPILINDLFGGFPWEVRDIYEHESPIYHLNNTRTPTHIITGENDMAVPVGQSFILERGLNYLNVPVQLLIFPNEQHSFNRNPWHGKIKLREELKWLKKYGHRYL